MIRNTTKLHQGKSKHEKSGKGEKAPISGRCVTILQFKKAEKQIVKADKKLKVGGDLKRTRRPRSNFRRRTQASFRRIS